MLHVVGLTLWMENCGIWRSAATVTGVCDELQNVTQKCVEVTLEPQRPQGLNHDDVAMSDSDTNLTGHRTSSLN